jgi:hypothetical protein
MYRTAGPAESLEMFAQTLNTWLRSFPPWRALESLLGESDASGEIEVYNCVELAFKVKKPSHFLLG